MAKSSNSISELEKKRTEMLSNSIEVLSKLTTAFTKNDLTVNLTLKDKDGKDVDITLPNLYSLDSEIKRIDSNVQALSGLDSSAYIQQADGTFKRIIASKRSETPDKINALKVPVEFGKRNNWFFENFLSPLLYINFDLTDMVDDQVRKVAVKRFIINTDDETQVELFNNALKGRSDLDYEETLLFLAQQNIPYFVDDDTYELPPAISRFEGSFGVIKSFESFDSSLERNVRYYKLSNVTYTDNLSSYKNSVNLKVGDVLSLDDSNKYEIRTIDLASRQVTLKRLSGRDNIPNGDNVLNLESAKYSSKKISVNIGYDEKQIIFVKPINTEFNITTTEFSNGVCFESNDLTLKDNAGNEISLESYYQNEVTDFGMHIMNLSKERTIPSTFGNIPNPPTLNENNFKVVQINTHLEQENLTKNIKTKLSEKTRLKNEIENIDREIFELTKKVQIAGISSSERAQYSNKVSEMVNRKSSKLSEYTSILTDLNNTYKGSDKNTIRPKYHVRGFWDYPKAKRNSRTGDQNIVQFIIQYRYLNNSGSAPGIEEIDYQSNEGNSKKGVFSNWIELKTKPRDRYYDLDQDKFLWDTDDTADTDKVNSNQLDLPISPGETVEVRIKSVSEAGYPSNPLMSDFSDPITIAFPENLNSEIDLYSLLEESAREEERSFIYKQIQEYGLERHFRTTIIRDDKYFAHAAHDLFSGFNGSNGDPLSVYDKIKTLEERIDTLQSQLKNQTPVEIKNGKMRVFLEGKDKNGNQVSYPIKNNTTLDVDLPNYFDQIRKLDIGERRGAILKEDYKLVIENVGDGPLKLTSKYPGAIYEKLPELSGSNLVWRNSSFHDDEYRNLKLYDKVPVKYSNFSAYENVQENAEMFGYGHQQASQVAGQFIYNRYKDLTGTKSLYAPGDRLQPLYTDMVPNSNTNRRGFIWDYTWFDPTSNTDQLNPYQMAPNGNGILSEFCVHINHSDIKDNRKVLYELIADNVLKRENLIEHAKFFNVEKGKANFNKQSELTKNTHGKFLKYGFYENDRFLIGENTTGMYFYMNPDTPQAIRVNGNDSSSVYELEPGDRISIPLTAEYRMTDFYDEADNYVINQKINNNDINISSLSPKVKLNQNSISSLHLSNSNYVTSKQYLGVVGGYNQSNFNRKDLNISYEKILGFDIYSRNNPTFSFDIRARASYGSNRNTILLEKTDTSIDDIIDDRIKVQNDSTVLIDNSLLNNGNSDAID